MKGIPCETLRTVRSTSWSDFSACCRLRSSTCGLAVSSLFCSLLSSDVWALFEPIQPRRISDSIELGDNVRRDGVGKQSECGIVGSLKTAEKLTENGCSMIRRTEGRELSLGTVV